MIFVCLSVFLIALRISIDSPQGFGIYNGTTRATNPEGTIRFTIATQIQVTLIDPADGTTYVITGTTRDINLTANITNLTGSINITQARLYTDISGVFTITQTINLTGTPPYTITFNLTGVPLGTYRWNVEAVSSDGQTTRAPSDWHFTIQQPGAPPAPSGGGGSKRPTREEPSITEEPVIPPPPVIIEIPMPLPPEPKIVHEFTGSADLSLLQSLTSLRIKVPGKEDALQLNIKESEEDLKWIVSEAEPLPEFINEWDLLSIVRLWRLKRGEWQDFPLIAENKILNYRPVSAARLSTGNSVPIGITTNATGEKSKKNITHSTITMMPVTSPPYFVKVTDVVDGYIGIYFVLDGYNFKTKDNEFEIDFELNLDKELVLADILPTAKLYPDEYNIIYKRYKLPDLPKKAIYDLTSRVYEKGPKLTNIAATYRSTVDFRKEVPTQMGKTIIS
ncbi:MAG: hypothetical protein QW666_03175 [Candidatus Woesearchaeota archaeon]